jgi:uncharacterized protein (DUF1919 family)
MAARRHLVRRAVTLVRDPVARRQARLRRRLRRTLAGSDVAIIGSNCIGGRIASEAGNPYRSPTVGLIVPPASFVELASDLPRYLDHEIVPDADASAVHGCPVGRMGAVELRFVHYASFDEAVDRWRARAARVDPDRVVLLWTDRGAMTDELVDRFAALPAPRKLMLTARPRPGLDFVAVVPGCAGAPTVDDLFTRWDLLEPVLRGDRLDLFR